MTPSAHDLALAARRAAQRGGHQPTGVLPADPVPPRAGTAVIGPSVPLEPRITGTPPVPPHAPGVASESCPGCGAPIPLDTAWCLTCGSSRGVATATPRETYLRACVAALELLRESHRRVRPLAETRQAEGLLEVAIERLRAGEGL